MGFFVKEVIFSPTTDCNLNCPHCDIKGSGKSLSKKLAQDFLSGCEKIGIRRVGFTGGEPFLRLDFLCSVVKHAVRLGMLFDRVMTNAVWQRSEHELKGALGQLREAGYDGSLCISVDAFHNQNMNKIRSFINTALSVWNAPDIVSIAWTGPCRGALTKAKLKALAVLLKARLISRHGVPSYIKSRRLFIKILKIDLSPVGKASRLKNPWGREWLKEDYCEGPGNVFFVMPDGAVMPCCGYATALKELTIGNIKRDSPRGLMKNFRRNAFAFTVFNSGLEKIRKRLEKAGFRFPGKTDNHCYFCHYLLTAVPRRLLDRCLDI